MNSCQFILMFMRKTFSLLAVFCVLLVSALQPNVHAAAPIPFVAPKDRPLEATEIPWKKNSFITIAYHDVQDNDTDQRYLTLSTGQLIAQFAWLRENGYKPVSVDQILAARNGGPELPPKAVLLSFDDGFSSFYHRVFPLLKATGWPAVWAPVGKWMDTPEDSDIDFGGLPTPRKRFANWDMIKEVAASGLVEVGAHTYNLHYGAQANPQGNTQPVAATYLYDAATASYETDAAFKQRLEKDVSLITQKITAATGKSPRVWVWPYGAANGSALQIIQQHGYQMAMTLEDGVGDVNRLLNIPRILIAHEPSVSVFGNAMIAAHNKPFMRVAHIDLDYVYDPDPVQQERNLDALVQRIYDLRINTVFLQAFADPKGDGNVQSLYFPNRWLPVKADLFNRVAWQLRSRAGVAIYAWMPVLSFELDPALPRVKKIPSPASSRQLDAPHIDFQQYRRLSPFDETVRLRIGEIYEDLARHAWIDGILFHDDALLSDFEDSSPSALAAYQAAGFTGDVSQIRSDPATIQRWTRFKSQHLVDFTVSLAHKVRTIRGPHVKTARNIFAAPILNPASEEWFAQNLDDFLRAYDWTAPMAMPLMENVPPPKINDWLDSLVDAVAKKPGALDKTVFEIQATDWRKDSLGPVATEQMVQWLRRLQLRGARNFGYYPDNFIAQTPDVQILRPALSNYWFPRP